MRRSHGAVDQSSRTPILGATRIDEQFTLDALGDLLQRVDQSTVVTQYSYTPKTDRLAKSLTFGQAADTNRYDAAGDLTHDARVEALPTANLYSIARSYYGSDGRLRVLQKLVTVDTLHPENGVSDALQDGAREDQLNAVEEYRYDALGRRVLTRLRRPLCGDRCVTAIERSVWDGDALLQEIRYPGRDGIPADSLEVDAGYVVRYDTTSRTDTGTVEVVPAYSRYYGTVQYTHGQALDEPLMLTRSYYGQDSTAWGDVDVVLHYSDQDVVDERTFTTGYSTASQSLDVQWPGMDVGVFGTRTVHGMAPSWFGGLPDHLRDASGLQYKRSRYYDPASGRFTQEDPIGLAGGVNLYGFAGGDPVNHSDPFGLCPPEKPLCEWVKAALIAAGTDIGGVAGGGAGLLAGPGALVASPAGALAGMGAGAAIGAAAGEMVDRFFFSGDASTGSDGGARRGDPAKGLRKQLEIHQKRLEDYRANPDAFDNKGFLKDASPELREKIVNSRIRELEGQIRDFEKQIKAISGGQ